MFKRSILLFVMLLITSLVVFASDDKGNPNEPADNDRANACYEDGSMAGKCDTQWEWECGWYLIRFESGMISPDTFPAGCGSVLPLDVVTAPSIGCQLFTGTYVFFTGNFLPTGTTTYTDAACTIPSGTTGLPVVYAPGGMAEVTTICAANGFGPGGLIAGDVYHCA